MLALTCPSETWNEQAVGSLVASPQKRVSGHVENAKAHSVRLVNAPYAATRCVCISMEQDSPRRRIIDSSAVDDFDYGLG